MRKSFLMMGVLALFAPLFVSCSSNEEEKISFEKSEYTISSGETVKVKQKTSGVTYSFMGSSYDNLKVEASTGKITFNDIPNYTQVLYTAKKGTYVTDPVVLTLLGEIVVPALEFVDATNYICDNNYIYAISSTNSSIAYKLENAPSGITIDASSGLVRITDVVEEGATFDVVISSNGASKTKTFTAIKNNLVTVKNDKQVTELDNRIPVSFNLDFSNAGLEYEHTVHKVINGHQILGEETYTYDSSLDRLTLSLSALSSLNIGENIITIVTSRNMVNVNVILATKIVKTAQDLAGINKNIETLSGYYVLGNDVDLTSYLAKGGEGYNSGKGWTPIGLYHDVLDGTAYRDTFKGTFDGNGYTIRGFYMNRTDEYGFNAGLFGYVYNIATIKNLSLEGGPRGNLVASFSGTIAGVNEGVISNCISSVNVSNNHGADAYHIVGGLVGRNLGSINHSIALGKVDGEAEIGAFVGLNEGEIINCYASKTSYSVFSTGLEPVNSYLYDSLAALQEDKHNMDLDETYWDITDDNLKLKHHIEFYFPYNLMILNEEDEYTIGDVIDLDIAIYPESLYEQYKDQIVVSTNDENVSVSGLNIDTSSATINDLIVSVFLDVQGYHMVSEKVFHVYEPIETISIVNDFTNSTVEPGKRYELLANITPGGASQDIEWSLYSSAKIHGLSIEGNILTVDENVEHFEMDNFQVIASSGGKSASLLLNINRPLYLGVPTQVLYSDDVYDITYLFPNTVDLTNAKLYRYNKQVDFVNNGDSITISHELVSEIPDTDITFKLVLHDGTFYRLYASYLSHEKYQVNNLPTDALAIGSVADFDKYFNVLNFDDPTRFRKYYDKTFYLTSDIDFEGQTIYGIGYNDESTSVSREFTGKIYGFGHTIRNANITDSEKYFTLTTTQRADKYRSSLYGVGFFGAFAGQVYDVNFDNVNVTSNSWNGGFAGTMKEGSIIENVHFFNSTVKNADGHNYSGDSLRTGKFTSSNSGIILACSFNGSIIGLVGE